MTTPKVKVKSEDELGTKLDRCFADTLIKTSGGLALGIVVSVVLAKRRVWPVWLGTGIGLGMGYSNCQHEIRAPFLLHGKKVKSPVSAADAGKTAGDYVMVVDQKMTK